MTEIDYAALVERAARVFADRDAVVNSLAPNEEYWDRTKDSFIPDMRAALDAIGISTLLTAAQERDALAVEVGRLRGLAGACYAGLCTECDLPEAWLDALAQAACGEVFDIEPLLPFTSTQRVELATLQAKHAALVARVEGAPAGVYRCDYLGDGLAVGIVTAELKGDDATFEKWAWGEIDDGQRVRILADTERQGES